MRRLTVLLFATSLALAAPALASSSSPGAVRQDTEAKLVKAVLDAGPKNRSAAYDALRLGAEEETVKTTLETRAAAAVTVLQRGSTLKQLGVIADRRRTLDAAREGALRLIFDEERYFTPYRVPAVTPEKAAAYSAVQREVDEHVDLAAQAWSDKKKAKLPRRFRVALEDLRWTRDRRAALDPAPERRRGEHRQPKADPAPYDSGGLPEWIGGLELGVDVINVRTFAWTAGERAELARSRRVVASNTERMRTAQKDEAGTPEAARPSSDEIEQVRCTNEYRLMMGRTALAWHPSLQAATRWHSDYMSRWGLLTHYEEEDAERRTFADRCRLEGYERPAGENCSVGSPDPAGTQAAWARSSGHHRNLLGRDHTEMASALSGSYWTQNFGRGDVTLDPPPVSD